MRAWNRMVLLVVTVLVLVTLRSAESLHEPKNENQHMPQSPVNTDVIISNLQVRSLSISRRNIIQCSASTVLAINERALASLSCSPATFEQLRAGKKVCKYASTQWHGGTWE